MLFALKLLENWRFTHEFREVQLNLLAQIRLMLEVKLGNKPLKLQHNL